MAFQFLNTKVFGLKWPGFTHFFEVNLRFYVKFRAQRAVCFIREYVPSHVIARLARMIYNEPYKYASISNITNKIKKQVSTSYQLTSSGASMLLNVTAKNSPYLPPLTSMEHFFKEHELGVGQSRTGKTLTYKVEHPHWKVYPIITTKTDTSFSCFCQWLKS